MSATITKMDSMDGDGDYRQIKVIAAFKDAYVDRYRRLGYREVSVKTEQEGGKTYAVIVMKRELTHPQYRELNEIEESIYGLLDSAKDKPQQPAPKKNGRKIALLVLLWAGVAVIAAGVVLLIVGFLQSIMGLALGGWGIIILGAVSVIVWSFLRESWRMRKKDIADDAENPGFGIDEISREIELKLTKADELCGNVPHKKKAQKKAAAQG